MIDVKKERIDELYEKNQYVEIRSILSEMNYVDIAELFEELDGATLVPIFRMLPKDDAANVFAYLSGDSQQRIITKIKDKEIQNIVEEMFLDDAVDFIEEMPAGVVTRVLSNIPQHKRELINQFLKYPLYSAGSVMTVEYISLKEHLTVQEAFERIRREGIDSETIYTCYVTDYQRRLLGEISIKTLLLAKPDAKVGELMDAGVISAITTDDQEELANKFRKYGLLAMPVVDYESRIVGIVTVDDVMNIQEEEATEDFEIMAAMSPSEEPYLKTSTWILTKNRLPWLLLLMLSATVTGAIIASFEMSLSAMPVLMTFIPMLMDTGGNAGSQSSTIIIRGMAIDEIRITDIFKVLWKEFRVSLICGAGLAFVNFLRVLIMNKDAALSLTVSFSLLFTVILAKTVACCLPMVAKRLKLDPAVMAAPIITTLVDAGALILFLSISKVFFNI